MAAEDKGDKLAAEYMKKLDRNEVSLDWAYRVIVTNIRDRRILRMVRLALKYNFQFEGINDLVGFVTDKMRSKGLDATDMEAIDSYLNSEFM
jgi:hypothetical protein